MLKQIKVDIDQVLNQRKVPAAYKQAVELAAELIKETGGFGSEITVTGQSMGGGIANYVGLKLGIKSVCYNAAALGGAAIQDLQESTYKTENNIERACLDKDNINNQIQVRRNRDVFSGEKQQIKISQFANIFYNNVVTPQNIGPIFVAHDSDIPLQNGKPEGTKSRHRTSTFDAFYRQPIPEAITPPDNSDASSESSSASSPSGGEKS
jgi:acetyl esterase/lipase